MLAFKSYWEFLFDAPFLQVFSIPPPLSHPSYGPLVFFPIGFGRGTTERPPVFFMCPLYSPFIRRAGRVGNLPIAMSLSPPPPSFVSVATLE